MRPTYPRILKGIGLIMGTSVAGQLLTVVFTPLLSNLYAPEDFGAYSLIVALGLIIGTVATWRLDLAIPIAEDDASARKTARTAILLACGTSLLAAAPVLLWLGNSSTRNAPHFVLLYLTATSIAAFSTYSQLALRRRDYRSIGIRNVTQPASSTAIQVLLGFVSQPLGLLHGSVIGRLLAVATLHARVAPHGATGESLKCSTGAVLLRYWRFPLVFTPSALFNVMGSQLPIIIGSAHFGGVAVGLFTMGQRFTTAPAALVHTAVGQVISAELGERLRRGQRRNTGVYLQFTGALLALAAAGVILSVTLLPRLTTSILPPEWAAVNAYIPSLTILLGSSVLASPLSVVFLLYEAAWLTLALDVSRVTFVLLAAQIAVAGQLPPEQVFTAMAIGQGANYLLSWAGGLVLVSRRTTPSTQQLEPASDEQARN